MQNNPPLTPDPAPEGGEQDTSSLLSAIKQVQTMLSPEYVVAHADVPATPPSGGDFHHAFPIQDGSGAVAVVIGDIAGHGPEQTAQAEHMQELLADCLNVGLTPAETLEAVNALIEPDPNFEGFGTVFVGKIAAQTGDLVYASGGHEPALVATPASRKKEGAEVIVEELVGTGPPVGAFPAGLARFEQQEATLPEGGTLLLYTDGVSDARPPHTRREWLGVEGLKEILAQTARATPRRLVAGLLRRVLAFCRGRFDDDVAVMAVRRRLSRRRRQNPSGRS